MDLRGVGVKGDPESASSIVRRCLSPEVLRVRGEAMEDLGDLLEEEVLDLKNKKGDKYKNVAGR